MGRYTKTSEQVDSPKTYLPSPSEIAEKIKNRPLIGDLPAVSPNSLCSVPRNSSENDYSTNKLDIISNFDVSLLYAKVDEIIATINNMALDMLTIKLKINELVSLENDKRNEL
jgi:hypothetical protein